MLNSQGLGEMVSRKKDAYQNNPQALQQRYQQSQELVDLLALQQLKSEKEAAARNMQMQMQQNPATIAQQREQEVLGMIKQEQGRKLGDVAQRTAGTLGEINKRAQQNVQRTAKQGLPTMRSPERRMAEGGIVAFQEGSIVTDAEIEEYLARFNLSNTPRNRELAKQEVPELKRQEAVSAARTEALTGKTPGTALRRAQRQFEQEYDPTEALGGPPKPKPPVEKEPLKRQIPDMGGKGVLAPEPPKSDSDDKQPQGLEALGLAPAEPIKTTVGTERQDLAKSIMANVGIDPSKNRADARKEAEDRTKGILEGAAGIVRDADGNVTFNPKEDQLRRLRELQAQQTDPDKLRRQQLLAGLIGAAGRGSTALAGFGAGAFNQRAAQEAAATANLAKQFGIENEKIQLDLDIAGKQITSGKDAVDVLGKDQRAALVAYQQAASDDRAIAVADADRAFESNRDGVKTKVELFLNRMEDRRAAAEQASNKELAYAELAAEFIKDKRELQKELLGESGVAMATDSNEFNEALDRSNRLVIEFHQLLERGGVNDFEEQIKQRAGVLSNAGGSSGLDALGIDLDPSLASIVEDLQ